MRDEKRDAMMYGLGTATRVGNLGLVYRSLINSDAMRFLLFSHNVGKLRRLND